MNTTRWRTCILVLALTLFVGMLLFFKPPDLGLEGQHALAVFALCLVLWVTNVVPLAMTSLLALALLPLVGALDAKETFSLFGNQSLFFILGAFILAAAVMKTGLSIRLALLLLSRIRKTPRYLLFGILISSAFLAFWIPEHAVAALMFPIVLEFATSLKCQPRKSHYGKALFLSLTWGTVIGGVGTFLGGARNPLAIGLLWEEFQIRIGFLEWMIAVVPIVAVMLLFAFGVILFFFQIDVPEITSAEQSLTERIRQMGPMTKQEMLVGGIMLVTIICWMTLSHSVGLANIALIAAASLFILNIVEWKEIEAYVNWGVLLMYGGAVTIGYALDHTKAASWIAQHALFSYNFSAFALTAIITLVAKFLTEGISNVATVAILLPLGFAIARDYGINPVIMVYAVAVPAGLAFCLPMGTPPNAICFASGYYKISDVFLAGILLNIISAIVFFLMMALYWPLIGITWQ